MGKQVSPAFAVIVILVVIVLGALWFMVRYRAAEARFRAESAALQAQADSARRSGRGRMGGDRPGRMGMMRGGRKGAAPGSAPGRGPAAAPKAGAQKPGQPTPATRGR